MGLPILKLGKSQAKWGEWVTLVKATASYNKLQEKYKSQSTREIKARVHSAKGQGKVTWAIFCHSLLFQMLHRLTSQLSIMNLNSDKCVNCHLTLYEVPSVFTLSVWFIPGQNSKCIQNVHRKYDFISHKPGSGRSITVLISLKHNLISTLNPQFQLTADKLIESLK